MGEDDHRQHLDIARELTRHRLGLASALCCGRQTYLSASIVLLPVQELSPVLYMISLLLMITGFVFAIWAAPSLGRSISICRRPVSSSPAGAAARAGP
jgi:hypothetical protein